MALKRKTAPLLQPLSRDEVKAHLRVQHNDDDVLIDGLIESATSYLDGPSGIMGRCLMAQDWYLYYDAFPNGDLLLPLANLLSVVAVEYVDPSSLTYVTWTQALNYEVDATAHEGWVIPVHGWPAIAATSNAMRVTFRCGFGELASDVPAAIRLAMKLMIGHWYENRETVNAGTVTSELPLTTEALLAPFRRVGV
jgi:uncharacterized phiE125 gp8 family phage protein